MNNVLTAAELTPAADGAPSPIPADRINELYRGEIFTEESARIARDRIHWMCSQVTGDSVLDVGCSQGITAFLLAREGCNVTAIDTHPDSIAFARNELALETPLVQSRVRLLETDLASLPEAAGFDTIVMGEVLEHQALPERFLRAGATRLNPNGRLVITTPFALHPHPDHKISVFPSQVATLARRLELSVVHLDVADQYIRCVLERTQAPRAATPESTVLRMTEQATLESQRRLFDRLDERSDQLKKKNEQFKTTQRKLAEASAQLEEARAESARRSEQLRAKVAEAQKTRDEAMALAAQQRQELAAAHTAHDAAKARLHDAQARVAAVQAELAVEKSAAREARAERDRLSKAGALHDSVDRRAAERESATYQARIAALEMRAQAVLRSPAHRLGDALVGAAKSGRGLLALPGALWSIGHDVVQRRRQRRGKVVLSAAEMQSLCDGILTSGVEPARARVEADAPAGAPRAGVYQQLSRELRTEAPNASAALARLAHAEDPQPFRAKWLAFRLFDAGALREPVQLLQSGAAAEMSASELRRADEIRALHRLQEQLPRWQQCDEPPYAVRPGVLMYVSASSLPYHTSGYSIRSQALLQALAGAGLKVHAVTRPGYPWDRQDRLETPSAAQTRRGEVEYRHLRQPNQSMPLDAYLREAAEALKREAARVRAAAIQAASNHVNALPALIAARELGLPFAFEMRGLWDLTRAARIANYESSERFVLGDALERHCALHADRVYVISDALRRRVLDWGVEPSRVTLLPNCVDAVAGDPSAGSTGTPTLGYAGSILHYEGLALLVEALAALRRDGTPMKAVIVGDGEALPALREQVRAEGLDELVTLHGRMAPDQAQAVLASCDAVVLPRLPLAVCEIVPPLKLVEAMALGKPVVVADLQVVREEVQHERTGLLFKAGDLASLRDTLRGLLARADRGASLGRQARDRVAAERLWAGFAQRIAGDLRDPLARPAAPAGAAPPLSGGDAADIDLQALVEAYERGGAAAVSARVAHPVHALGPRTRAMRLLQLAKVLGEGSQGAAAELDVARAALQADRSEQTLRGFFWSAQRTRAFEEACATIGELEALYGAHPTPAQQETLGKLHRSPAYQLTLLRQLDVPAPQRVEAVPRRIAYVLHNSLPYSSGGYATRSHGVASGLRQNGFDVVVLTRPGFPVDIKPDLDAEAVPPDDVVDGIRYRRTLQPKRSGLTMLEYVTGSANALELQLRQLRPELVMAASNHVTALPALIAARRLGLPFVYEVRGLWEVTRLSRDNEFEDSPAFAIQRLLETKVAQHAVRVYTLTEPMREELVARGVPAERIGLLPNSCDPTRFAARERDSALAAQLGLPDGVPVIGYVGTFVDYEGLDDLAAACALLKQRGVEFRLLLVGNENASGQERGPVGEAIVATAREAGFSDWLVMPGRVPHDEVERYYSLINVAPFPRKPWPVCEMVSPMKPLEALAMQKAVVVSSVRALAEMIRDRETGRVFDKGDASSLADALEKLIGDPGERAALGRRGRAWVERQRTWLQTTATLHELFPEPPRQPDSAAPSATIGAASERPRWWTEVDEPVRSSGAYVDVVRWPPSATTVELRERYVQRFGEEAVKRRMPANNWARAEICAQTVEAAESLLDVGSGLGEFVNLLALRGRHSRITSVDLRDYDLWLDATGQLNRVYSDLFALDPKLVGSDVVTCFEVIEHLPPERVGDAVHVLRSLARRKLYVSVPFLEPLPLYPGHKTRFDGQRLASLFPDARFTVFGKGNGTQPLAWILCDIDIR
jgi:glycosyltransferase involved in cell wall biosynthesis/2-polyprenyl-3-methyl-5-hydroxy-6-metoxy-1,4-benzoquinol methylase